jgi:hypothetical protein
MAKKKIIEEKNENGLSKRAQLLLDKLIEDMGTPGLPPEDRIFRKERSSGYIYNLLKGKYKLTI